MSFFHNINGPELFFQNIEIISMCICIYRIRSKIFYFAQEDLTHKTFSDTGIQQQLYNVKTTEARLQHQDDFTSLHFSGMITKARLQQQETTLLHYGD